MESIALGLDSIDESNVTPSSQTPLLVGAGQTFTGLPAALAVGKKTEASAWEFPSLMVSKPFRHLGLATRLLDGLGHEARHRGFASLSLIHILIHAFAAAMMRLSDPLKDCPLSEALRFVQFDGTGGLALLEKLVPVSARWLGSRRLTVVS